MKNVEFQELPPRPVIIESMRHVGYSLSAALADIIDNAITAEATVVDIWVSSDENDPDPYVAIVDDGHGMSESELVEAMQIGSADPLQRRKPKDLGRFGLGMKTGSFSQCRRLTVVSIKEGVISAREWDLDFIREKAQFLLITPDIDSIPMIEKLRERDNGTMVLWTSLDKMGRVGSVNFTSNISEAREDLELTFHRFLHPEPGTKKVTIRLNGLELKAFDPFFTRHSATSRSPHQSFPVGEGTIGVEVFTLPHHANVTESEWQHYGGREGYVINQGFYIYRERRLIIKGTWLNLARRTELSKLTRVKVDLHNDVDEEWGIDIKKSSAQLPDEIKEALRRLIGTMTIPSNRVFKGRGTPVVTDDRRPIWVRHHDRDRIYYEIDRNHPIVSDFCAKLQEESKEQFKSVVDAVNGSLPMDALFADLAGEPEKVKQFDLDPSSVEYSSVVFYRTLKESGIEHESIVAVMQTMEPFVSNWEITEGAIIKITSGGGV